MEIIEGYRGRSGDVGGDETTRRYANPMAAASAVAMLRGEKRDGEAHARSRRTQAYTSYHSSDAAV